MSYSINKNYLVVMDSLAINKCVDKCANYINRKFDGQDIICVGILKGAVYFFVDLTRKITIPHSCYFIESSSYHDNQTQSECNIMSSIEPSKFLNKQVILIDELFDNGETMFQVKKAIHEKANIPLDKIFTCTAFKKNKITKYESPDIFGAIVPNVWLIGYGLDDKQKCRNYVELYACPKSENVPKTEDDKMFEDTEYHNKIVTSILFELDKKN